jgi:deazaflavin-dependent oxidoreductase (nitroreductase family)
MTIIPSLRHVFRFLNRYFMVPMFRLGFGPFMGNPFSGYIMVLKTTGRKSGQIRYSPVNYAIQNGDLFCMAGWGKVSDWFRNILADPNIEVIHPDGPLAGICELVTDPGERIVLFRKILRNAGFAGFLDGFNPITITDEELQRRMAELPLIRIHPTGLGNGPMDPGGLAWLWTPISIMLAIILLVILL